MSCVLVLYGSEITQLWTKQGGGGEWVEVYVKSLGVILTQMPIFRSEFTLFAFGCRSIGKEFSLQMSTVCHPFILVMTTGHDRSFLHTANWKETVYIVMQYYNTDYVHVF